MTKKEILHALFPSGFFSKWMGKSQRQALRSVINGEEGDHFVQLLSDLRARIEAMPASYETDGEGDNAVVHLHYFRGSIDAWITEKDAGDGSEDDSQYQAFGKITLTGSKEDAEFGYISIEELIGNDVELDLYWEPKRLAEI